MKYSNFQNYVGEKRRLALKKYLEDSNNYLADAKMTSEQWSITELVNNPEAPAIGAIQMLDDSALSIAKNIETSKTTLDDGKRRLFRLQVLTRQACHRDKDGKKISQNPQNDEEFEVCPSPTDKPMEGDIVRFKGNRYRKDPETGADLTKTAQRNKVLNDGREIYQYREFTVDSDGCINNLPFVLAFQALKQNGMRIASPRFRDYNSNITKENGRVDKKQRRITNWWFKEVDADFTTKSTRTYKKKGEGVEK